jgi:hypothetical protein
MKQGLALRVCVSSWCVAMQSESQRVLSSLGHHVYYCIVGLRSTIEMKNYCVQKLL